MRVLVTGGAGFIGSHTVDALLQKGYQVRILDALLPPVHSGAIPNYIPRDEVDIVVGDVSQRCSWEKALEGVDVVFHLAAHQGYLPNFSAFFQTNTISTAHLYEVIVDKRLDIRKIVIASSQAVYGEGRYSCEQPHSADSHPVLREESQLRRGLWEILCPKCGTPMLPQWIDETIVNPHNQYAVSKNTQELIGLTLGRRYGIPTVCLRYSIVHGPRQSFRNAYSGVLRIFTQRVLNGKPPVCYEDGRQLRDYVSVHDVVRANLLVLDDPRADFEAFNVGGNCRVSVLDYAHLIARRVGKCIEPSVPGTYRFGDVRHILSDVAKLSALGWHPQVSLESIVDEYTAWATEQPDFRDYYEEAEARMAAVGTIRKAVSFQSRMEPKSADSTDDMISVAALP
ncbi:MAG TPA: NAD-dependent epimerase/dehydratase family protein [bacterium]|nr:NAD-dependent epimerase/dehydratase family protein [bacterium]